MRFQELREGEWFVWNHAIHTPCIKTRDDAYRVGDTSRWNQLLKLDFSLPVTKVVVKVKIIGHIDG